MLTSRPSWEGYTPACIDGPPCVRIISTFPVMLSVYCQQPAVATVAERHVTTSRPGGELLGGHSTHSLLPEMTAFQADVELGSCNNAMYWLSHRQSRQFSGVSSSRKTKGNRNRKPPCGMMSLISAAQQSAICSQDGCHPAPRIGPLQNILVPAHALHMSVSRLTQELLARREEG